MPLSVVKLPPHPNRIVSPSISVSYWIMNPNILSNLSEANLKDECLDEDLVFNYNSTKSNFIVLKHDSQYMNTPHP